MNTPLSGTVIRYFIPKSVEVSKEEYDAYVETVRMMSHPYPSWWEGLISRALWEL